MSKTTSKSTPSTASTASAVVQRMSGSRSAMHGLRHNSDWPAPRLVARSDKSNRPDQDNSIKANEYLDEEFVLDAKLAIVAALLAKSKHTCAYSGAGLSKSSGIPDYATKSSETIVDAPKLASVTDAQPTFAHLSLVALERGGLLHSWVNQNHDGLPQKAGFPQEKLNEIHGAWYDPSNPVVQFDESLRHDLFNDMLEIEEKTDLCLCLGSSLSGMNADRVAKTPAKKACKEPPKALGTILINLQQTALDAKCTVRIWARLDDAFKKLLQLLSLEISPFARPVFGTDSFVIPYNAEGKRDWSVRTTLYLAPGAKLKVCHPQARNLGRVGVVTKKDREGHWDIKLEGDRYRNTLGTWWVSGALKGTFDWIPMVNVGARAVPAPPTSVEPPSAATTTSPSSSATSSSTSTTPSKPSTTPAPPKPPAETSTLTSSSTATSTSPTAASKPPTTSTTTTSAVLPAAITVIQGHKTRKTDDHSWDLKLDAASCPFVQSVTWELHPTFEPPSITIDKPPFCLKRIGWGTFKVGVRVQLKPAHGSRVITGKHELTFDSEGESAATTQLAL
ncbi:NAD-dependent protein deacetylase sirtuin-7 [Pelomyxa schiedti]|nr:NAD-dependent protein deacetylase sirtuin-7 [Pelomyxa schiedti]